MAFSTLFVFTVFFLVSSYSFEIPVLLDSRWEPTFDNLVKGSTTFHAKRGSFISGLQSTFEPNTKDRKYKWRTSTFATGENPLLDNSKTKLPYTTSDGLFKVSCGQNGVITGVDTKRDDTGKDRQFQFTCSRLKSNFFPTICKWNFNPRKYEHPPTTKEKNSFLKFFDFFNKDESVYENGIDYTSVQNHVIVGLRSLYSKIQKDRLFLFRVCYISTVVEPDCGIIINETAEYQFMNPGYYNNRWIRNRFNSSLIKLPSFTLFQKAGAKCLIQFTQVKHSTRSLYSDSPFLNFDPPQSSGFKVISPADIASTWPGWDTSAKLGSVEIISVSQTGAPCTLRVFKNLNLIGKGTSVGFGENKPHFPIKSFRFEANEKGITCFAYMRGNTAQVPSWVASYQKSSSDQVVSFRATKKSSLRLGGWIGSSTPKSFQVGKIVLRVESNVCQLWFSNKLDQSLAFVNADDESGPFGIGYFDGEMLASRGYKHKVKFVKIGTNGKNVKCRFEFYKDKLMMGLVGTIIAKTPEKLNSSEEIFGPEMLRKAFGLGAQDDVEFWSVKISVESEIVDLIWHLDKDKIVDTQPQALGSFVYDQSGSQSTCVIRERLKATVENSWNVQYAGAIAAGVTFTGDFGIPAVAHVSATASVVLSATKVSANSGSEKVEILKEITKNVEAKQKGRCDWTIKKTELKVPFSASYLQVGNYGQLETKIIHGTYKSVTYSEIYLKCFDDELKTSTSEKVRRRLFVESCLMKRIVNKKGVTISKILAPEKKGLSEKQKIFLIVLGSVVGMGTLVLIVFWVCQCRQRNQKMLEEQIAVLDEYQTHVPVE